MITFNPGDRITFTDDARREAFKTNPHYPPAQLGAIGVVRRSYRRVMRGKAVDFVDVIYSADYGVHLSTKWFQRVDGDVDTTWGQQ